MSFFSAEAQSELGYPGHHNNPGAEFGICCAQRIVDPHRPLSEGLGLGRHSRSSYPIKHAEENLHLDDNFRQAVEPYLHCKAAGSATRRSTGTVRVITMITINAHALAGGKSGSDGQTGPVYASHP